MPLAVANKARMELETRKSESDMSIRREDRKKKANKLDSQLF